MYIPRQEKSGTHPRGATIDDALELWRTVANILDVQAEAVLAVPLLTSVATLSVAWRARRQLVCWTSLLVSCMGGNGDHEDAEVLHGLDVEQVKE